MESIFYSLCAWVGVFVVCISILFSIILFFFLLIEMVVNILHKHFKIFMTLADYALHRNRFKKWLKIHKNNNLKYQ